MKLKNVWLTCTSLLYVVAATPPACFLACIAAVAPRCPKELRDIKCLCDNSPSVMGCVIDICPEGTFFSARDHFWGTCLEHANDRSPIDPVSDDSLLQGNMTLESSENNSLQNTESVGTTEVPEKEDDIELTEPLIGGKRLDEVRKDDVKYLDDTIDYDALLKALGYDKESARIFKSMSIEENGEDKEYIEPFFEEEEEDDDDKYEHERKVIDEYFSYISSQYFDDSDYIDYEEYSQSPDYETNDYTEDKNLYYDSYMVYEDYLNADNYDDEEYNQEENDYSDYEDDKEEYSEENDYESYDENEILMESGKEENWNEPYEDNYNEEYYTENGAEFDAQYNPDNSDTHSKEEIDWRYEGWDEYERDQDWENLEWEEEEEYEEYEDDNESKDDQHKNVKDDHDDFNVSNTSPTKKDILQELRDKGVRISLVNGNPSDFLIDRHSITRRSVKQETNDAVISTGCRHALKKIRLENFAPLYFVRGDSLDSEDYVYKPVAEDEPRQDHLRRREGSTDVLLPTELHDVIYINSPSLWSSKPEPPQTTGNMEPLQSTEQTEPNLIPEVVKETISENLQITQELEAVPSSTIEQEEVSQHSNIQVDSESELNTDNTIETATPDSQIIHQGKLSQVRRPLDLLKNYAHQGRRASLKGVFRAPRKPSLKEIQLDRAKASKSPPTYGT